MPTQVGLQLARLADVAPAGNGWLHEIKFDGYRVLAWRDSAGVRITSRGGQDWTDKLAEAVAAIAQLPCRSCILDGELITLDPSGRSSFGLLQQRFGERDGERRLRVMLFDLLFVDDEDLRAQPQLERKSKLAELLRHAARPLVLSTYVIGGGARAAREACAHGLEGIVCKRIDAPYVDGRGGAWLKVKCVDSDEFAIIGYTRGKGARERLGSLLLATPTARGGWRYRGRVGTGMDERRIDYLLERLEQLRAGEVSQLEGTPSRAQLRGATPLWVRPHLVVEVEFRGYTEDQLLRQASVKGVRADRSVDSLRPSRRNSARVSRRQSSDRHAHRSRRPRKS
ncbi:MAG: non-homologous end-joining DNA ligase [Gammaproteobacteria bacterium]|nr:non-homologous end-joining DNA ligase [Gammaproteobacteria bacterium]